MSSGGSGGDLRVPKGPEGHALTVARTSSKSAKVDDLPSWTGPTGTRIQDIKIVKNHDF